MKRSMSLRGQAVSRTGGTGGSEGGMKDQCSWYWAPSATQRRSTAICAEVSVLCASGGGMISFSLRDWIRDTSGL